MRLEEIPKVVIPKGKEVIRIAICTLDMQINMRIGDWIQALIHLSYAKDCPWFFKFDLIHGFRHVSYARNVLAGNFIKDQGASRLWYIDSDMIPSISLFKLLQSHEADIVCGRMFAWNDIGGVGGREPGPSLCADMREEGTGRYLPLDTKRVPTDSLIEVDAIGTASMLIKREVMLDHRMYLDDRFTGLDGNEYRHRDFKEEEYWAPPIFREVLKPNGAKILGSDIDFCKRAKAVGYKIGMHTGATIGHHKEFIVDDAFALIAGHMQAGIQLGRAGEVWGKPDKKEG